MASSWTEEGAPARTGEVGGGPGAMVGASAIVEGLGAVWGSGAAGEPDSGRPTVSSDWRSSCFKASNSARSAASALVGHVDQIVVDPRLAPLPPIGLEPPADFIKAPGHFQIQTVEIVAGAVAHRDSVLGPRSIGCSPPGPASRVHMAKTDSPFQEDVRFACDCDIAFAICEFAGPRLFIASLSPVAPIDGDRAAARREKPVHINVR